MYVTDMAPLKNWRALFAKTLRPLNIPSPHSQNGGYAPDDKFSFLLDTKSLLTSRDLHDQLKKMCTVCSVAYPNDMSGFQLLAEIDH